MHVTLSLTADLAWQAEGDQAGRLPFGFRGSCPAAPSGDGPKGRPVLGGRRLPVGAASPHPRAVEPEEPACSLVSSSVEGGAHLPPCEAGVH